MSTPSSLDSTQPSTGPQAASGPSAPSAGAAPPATATPSAAAAAPAAATPLTTAAIRATLGPAQQECVKVCIRVRPLIHEAELRDRRLCLSTDLSIHQVTIVNPEDAQRTNTFTYDAIFGQTSTQVAVYEKTALPIVESVLEGYNGTVIAYGQTGAGKTFTMEGNTELPGLIPQCFAHIFGNVKGESQQKKFLVQCSMLQIYKEEVFDLLSQTPTEKKRLRENPETKEFYVPDLTTFMVVNARQIAKIMRRGQSNRAVHSTPMNPGSSRSHCIFQVKIETSEQFEETEEPCVRVGKLQLVDLAGSERAKKTGGVRQEEMIKINWGLTCLGNVIMSLTAPQKRGRKRHIPYRDSRLTRLLQDSLGGNTKTVLIANVSPSWYNYSETLSTLRYASRAKRIQNRPQVNEDPKDALIRRFQEQIEELRKQLAGGGAGGIVISGTTGGGRMGQGGPQFDESMLQKMRGQMEAEKLRLIESMRNKSTAEKEALLRQQEELEARKRKVEEQLVARADELKRQKEEQGVLRDKLQKMQATVMAGGVLKKENRAIRAEIRAQKQALMSAEGEQRELQRALAKHADLEEDMKQELVSTKGEVRITHKKLETLWQRYKATQAELEDMQASFAQEREEYIFTIRSLQRDMKLKELIIQNFIPPDHVRKIMNRALYDENEEEFTLRGLQLAGNRVINRSSAHGMDRPVSRFAMMQQDPRYKTRDILDFETEGPVLHEDVGSDDEDLYYY